jgi:hypothetical protein
MSETTDSKSPPVLFFAPLSRLYPVGSTVDKILTIVAVAFIACTQPAAANVNIDAPIQTAIASQAEAPVSIENCAAVANDFFNKRVSPPAYAYTQLRTEVTFKNRSSRDITAVRFGFIAQDSFNSTYGTTFGTIRGAFSPNVLIEPHRSGVLDVLQPDASAWVQNITSEDLGRVLCYISNVRFADGTVWTSAAIDASATAFSVPPNDLWKGAGTPSNPFEDDGHGHKHPTFCWQHSWLGSSYVSWEGKTCSEARKQWGLLVDPNANP